MTDDAPPHNLEAEQAVLGGILFDPAALNRIDPAFGPEHFYEPFHARLFSAIRAAVDSGFAPEPITLSEEFRGDPAFKPLGGIRYLADLVDRAPAALAPDYARVLIDLAVRRNLLRLTAIYAARARNEALPAADLVIELERDILDLEAGVRGPELVSIQEAMSGVRAYLDADEKTVGVSTGLRPLDLQLGPMLDGDLILIPGRPGMGKSGLALEIALNVAAPALADAVNGRPYDGRPPMGVIEFHGEMSWNDKRDGQSRGGQTPRRHLSSVAFGLYGRSAPTYKAIRDRTATYDQRGMLTRAIHEVGDAPIVGVKRTGITLSQIRAYVRRQRAEWAKVGIPLGLVIIDHVGLLRGEGRPRGRYEEQTDIAIGAKELAGEVSTPVVALVQLNRQVELRDDKRPMLADLRDSGAWEENADAVVAVYRDAYYAKREKEPNETQLDKWAAWDARCRSKDIELLMLKLREGDGGGTAKVWGEMAWNAIRSGEPERTILGDFL